jgi:transposase
VIAFERESQQAFLEAHVEAFRFFGGVFATIRYDNLARRSSRCCAAGVESSRTGSSRCAPTTCSSRRSRAGREGAHEQGGVEGEVGRYRRAHLVPVPKVASLKELNDRLENGCFADLGRRIRGRAETVGEALGSSGARSRSCRSRSSRPPSRRARAWTARRW